MLALTGSTGSTGLPIPDRFDRFADTSFTRTSFKTGNESLVINDHESRMRMRVNV
jgi:hypothetical protein